MSGLIFLSGSVCAGVTGVYFGFSGVFIVKFIAENSKKPKDVYLVFKAASLLTICLVSWYNVAHFYDMTYMCLMVKMATYFIGGFSFTALFAKSINLK